MDIFNQLSEEQKDNLLSYICENKVDSVGSVVSQTYCHKCKMIICCAEECDDSSYPSVYEYHKCLKCSKTYCYSCAAIMKMLDMRRKQYDICTNCK